VWIIRKAIVVGISNKLTYKVSQKILPFSRLSYRRPIQKF